MVYLITWFYACIKMQSTHVVFFWNGKNVFFLVWIEYSMCATLEISLMSQVNHNER